MLDHLHMYGLISWSIFKVTIKVLFWAFILAKYYF